MKLGYVGERHGYNLRAVTAQESSASRRVTRKALRAAESGIVTN